ncbi:hypothetical protein [Halorubrum sp. BV1]|uniref:hypothetical protein n=1 Tax=Halorubrum sp. BV1 TaxID=1498500 RepID=UPI0012BA8D58|nr:hypothetical protein [Halorubrum sp. BV1]
MEKTTALKRFPEERSKFKYQSGIKSIASGHGIYDTEDRELVSSEGGGKDLITGSSFGDGMVFSDADGREVCRLQSGSIRERLSGNVYSLVDAASDEPVAEISFPRSLTSHRAKVFDPDTGDLVAKVESDGRLSALLRESPARLLLPPSYTVLTPRERSVGTIEFERPTGSYQLSMSLDADATPKDVLAFVPLMIQYDIA